MQERLTGAHYHTDEIYSFEGEGDIADAVREAAKQHSQVHIGSYTNNERSSSADYNVKVMVQGRDKDAVREAATTLRGALQA